MTTGVDPTDSESLDRSNWAVDWAVDALVGSGQRGPLGPRWTASVRFQRLRGHILAVDLPSGLDCDSGQPMGDRAGDLHGDHRRRQEGLRRADGGGVAGRGAIIDMGLPRKAWG